MPSRPHPGPIPPVGQPGKAHAGWSERNHRWLDPKTRPASDVNAIAAITRFAHARRLPEYTETAPKAMPAIKQITATLA